jgi:hypothetical protein
MFVPAPENISSKMLTTLIPAPENISSKMLTTLIPAPENMSKNILADFPEKEKCKFISK